MTTNQTIDGVPRALLESICEHFEFGRRWQAMEGVKKLRALLGAPVHPCPVQLEGCDGSCAPAAQPHDEPMYQVCNGIDGWIDVDLLRYTACSLDPEKYEVRALYTEQPASVAVVRMCDCNQGSLPCNGECKPCPANDR